jgi:hypothetical protein
VTKINKLLYKICIKLDTFEKFAHMAMLYINSKNNSNHETTWSYKFSLPIWAWFRTFFTLSFLVLLPEDFVFERGVLIGFTFSSDLLSASKNLN